MLVFLDFEASSLGKTSYPIEVAWVFEDGTSETYLIAPAPAWTDWDPAAEAIHHIDRVTLVDEGTPAQQVADRMVAVLAGHSLHASAPSWDGKWLNVLFRATGYPKHTLRLRDTDEALADVARSILREVVPAAALDAEVETVMVLVDVRASGAPAHRALPDARAEQALWAAVRDAARARRDEITPRER